MISTNQNDNFEKFKSFVCYCESTGKVYADLVDDVLSSVSMISFVAHNQRDKYSENFDEVRKKVIENSNYFFFINTEGVFSSKEVQKEFNMAYPNGLSDNPKLIILRHKSSSPVPPPEFEKATGLKLHEINQATFDDEFHLVDVLCHLIEKYGISSVVPSKEQFQKKLKLIKYLSVCIARTEEENPIDMKSLAQLFIPNDAAITKTDLWEKKDDRILTQSDKWTPDSFLLGEDKLVVIGAPYGVGKTSFSLKLASDMATKALKNLSHEYIPIHISLKYKLDIIDSNQNTLDDILTLIPTKDTNILFIYDGLDEYEDTDKVPDIYDKLSERLRVFPNSKAIVTTRLITGYPRLLKIEKYVRLLPFTKNQVDQFFKKYGLPLTYDEIPKSGLDSDEISKPLFCWMIAIIYSKLNTIKISEELGLNRTLLFSTLIHNVIFGKHMTSTGEYGYNELNTDEKFVLRKISELKHIYEEDLTTKRVMRSIQKLDNKIDPQILGKFQILISSYFYNNEERLDFIHKSLVEYLLAEYIIDCFLKNQPYRINLKLPSQVTIQFLEALLELIGSEDSKNAEHTKLIIRSFSPELDPRKMKSILFESAVRVFNDDNVYLNDKLEYEGIEDVYENVSFHRWIAVMMINKLGNMYRIDSKRLFRLFAATHGSIPSYMISIDNIDLSDSVFDSEQTIGNWNLSKANLQRSKFHGRFNGTIFSGADLSNSEIEQSAYFMDCDFSGANLSDIRNRVDSPYGASFIRCNFYKCILKNSKLKDIDFTYSSLNDADLSDANISYSNFSLANLKKVTVSKNTHLKGIQLIGRMGTEVNDWWDQVKSISELVDFILSEMDPLLKDIILEDNPNLINQSSLKDN